MTQISAKEDLKRREALDLFSELLDLQFQGSFFFLLLCRSALVLVCKNVNVKTRPFLYLL